MMVTGDDQENGALVLDDMLTAYDVNNGFFAMDEDDKITDGTLNFNDFHNQDFPLLPDFSCMSSSSSSSSTQPPSKESAVLSVSSSSTSSATSSSSGTLWSVLRSDCDDTPAAAVSELAELSPPPPPPSTAVDCTDVMENFGYMDLLDVSDLWDPSSIFDENSVENNNELIQNREKENEEEERQLDELGAMFFEWLKNNKEHISAQDMRSIKLKKSTVESASKRLGTSNEGKKQLLKLILEWVENYQLQKKNNGETLPSQFPFSANPNPNPCYPTPPSWIPPQFDPAYSFSDITNFQNYPPPPPPPQPLQPPQPEYYHQMMDSSNNTNSWPASQFMMTYNQFPDNIVAPYSMNPSSVGFYGNQYGPQVFGENRTDRLLRLGSSSTTKEARKKRMARQRRVNSSHHHSRHHHHSSGGNGGGGGGSNNNNNHEQNDRNLRLGGEVSNPGTWVYLPCGSAPPPGASTVRMMPQGLAAGGGGSVPLAAKRAVVQSQNYHRQAAADRRQGWKQEKNLKFLLQKVLKQSDVGNLGRIVLPKKEAETHLPALDTRDGIAISMEDIGSSRVWNMRYRFWPNNKSRMYLLENTGEFVRANGLQEGDFIVIYSDIKCGKYLIRGVKVRQQGPKPEGKKTARRNLQRSSIPYESSSSPTKQLCQ